MKAVGRLDHPNIVQAYDAREIDGTPVLIMEFVEGWTWRELSGASGRCRWPTPANWSAKRPSACNTPTSTGWSTATSSRRTSCSRRRRGEAAGPGLGPILLRPRKTGTDCGQCEIWGLAPSIASVPAPICRDDRLRARRWARPTTWPRSRPPTAARSISGPTSTAWAARSTSS